MHTSSEHCPPDTLKLLGDYTTLRILDFLSVSGLRFADLHRELADTNSPTLINRLKRLVSAGLIMRSEATLDKKSVYYELSEIGKALVPAMREIKLFAERFPARPVPDSDKSGL